MNPPELQEICCFVDANIDSFHTSKLEAIKESLRETASGLLPLSIAKETSLKLRETILLENETRSHRTVSKVLSNKKKELIRMINSKDFLVEIEANQKEFILGYMKTKIENVFEPEEKEYPEGSE